MREEDDLSSADIVIKFDPKRFHQRGGLP